MTQTSINYKGREYSAESLKEMRNWILDCQWGDLDADEVAELSDISVLKGIDRNYCGGLFQFIVDNTAQQTF